MTKCATGKRGGVPIKPCFSGFVVSSFWVMKLVKFTVLTATPLSVVVIIYKICIRCASVPCILARSGNQNRHRTSAGEHCHLPSTQNLNWWKSYKTKTYKKNHYYVMSIMRGSSFRINTRESGCIQTKSTPLGTMGIYWNQQWRARWALAESEKITGMTQCRKKKNTENDLSSARKVASNRYLGKMT